MDSIFCGGLKMRFIIITAVLSVILSPGLLATVIAEDSLDYGSAVELNGQSGGTGWTGAWTADTARTEIESGTLNCCGGPSPVGDGSTSALEVIGGADNNEVISRQLSTGTNTTFYARVLVNLDAGTIEQDDFIVFWFDDNAGGGSHSGAPNFVLKNTGSAAELVARVGVGNEASTGVTPVLGTTYLLVAKFTHTGVAYNQVDIWLNPNNNGGVEPIPDATNSSSISSNASVTHIGIRTNALEVGDIFRFGEIMLGDTWSDVVPGGTPVELQSFQIN
jgi:hypothetical protein